MTARKSKPPTSDQEWRAIVAEARRDLANETAARGAAEARCATSTKEAGELRAEVAELRELVHDLEIDRARMIGYLDRIGEDEAEPIEPPAPPPQPVIRRYSPHSAARFADLADIRRSVSGRDGYGEAKPKPWYRRG